MRDKPIKWPVIANLPKDEQKPFNEWLRCQTVPVNDDGSSGYYKHDYDRWKRQWEKQKE